MYATNTDPPGTTLRTARMQDLDSLCDLEERCFCGDRLSRRSFRRFLHRPRAFMVVAEENGRVLAYALLIRRSTAKTARLYSLAVAPEHHGQGLAKRLLDRCERHAAEAGCERIILEVRNDNAAAIRLYERAGFRRFGVKAGYYQDGQEALRYQKVLSPGAVAENHSGRLNSRSRDP